MIGQSLGHYRIESKLGEGGMGVVYRAVDQHLGRDVAIKVLTAAKASDPARKNRFVHEAKAASALNHPNIITVHDVSEENGVSYIVMEYVPGKTIRDLIPRKGMALPDMLRYATQIADAVAKAHSAGILHRDLKPANIMVSDGGLVKVLDFGLAKLTEPDEPDQPDASDNTRTMAPGGPATQEGFALGTIAYMSPEQAQGKRLDARSDVFSFGAVMYEMLTGRRAFDEESGISTLAAILHKDPPNVTALVPRLPPELDHIVLRCLRKEPRRRFQSAVELKAALEDLRDSLGMAPRSVRAHGRSHRRLWAVAAGGLAAASLLIAGALYWLPGARLTILESTPIATEPGSKSEPTFSPDGSHIAYRWDGEKQDNHDIYVRLLGTASALRLTRDPADDVSPSWSPDGRWIAFLRHKDSYRTSVMLIPPLGGPERNIADTWGNESSMSWSADGKWLFLKDQVEALAPEAIYALSVETGEKRRLTNPGKRGDRDPVLSPDGKTLAFVRYIQPAAGDVYLLRLRDVVTPAGEPVRATYTGRIVSRPAWTPDGRELIVVSGPAGNFRLSRLVPDGKSLPERILGDEVNFDPAISRSGRRLAYTKLNYDTNIWRVDPSGKPGAPAQPAELVASSRLDFNPWFSPDGSRLVFSSNRTGNFEIWTSNSDGSGVLQLTSFNGVQVGSPRWSPVEDRIAFDYIWEGEARVYTMSASGGRPVMVPGTGYAAVPSWSHDGKWLYFASNKTGRYEIWKIQAEGGTPVQVTRHGGYVSQESADGRTLFFAKTDGAANVWKIPVEGGADLESLAIADKVQYRAWSPSRRGIWFIPFETGKRRYLKFARFGGDVSAIAQIDKPIRWGLTVSPDERQVLYSQVDQYGRDLMLVEGLR